MKAAPTPLPSNTVLRTDSESKPRCPEQTEAYNFTNFNILRCPEQSEVYNFNPFNKKGRKCALAHTARTVRGDIDQRKVES